MLKRLQIGLYIMLQGLHLFYYKDDCKELCEEFLKISLRIYPMPWDWCLRIPSKDSLGKPLRDDARKSIKTVSKNMCYELFERFPQDFSEDLPKECSKESSKELFKECPYWFSLRIPARNDLRSLLRNYSRNPLELLPLIPLTHFLKIVWGSL